MFMQAIFSEMLSFSFSYLNIKILLIIKNECNIEKKNLIKL